MIKFSAVINLAPFPEEMKKDLIAKEDQMNEDQKFRLVEGAWEAITMIYETKIRKTLDDMMQEMAQGKKTYEPNDFQEAKTKIMYEFAQKLDAVKTEADLVEVKNRLQKMSSQK